MDTINIVTAQHPGPIKGLEGHIVGLQGSWYFTPLDRLSMLDKEEWFVEKHKALGEDIYEILNSLEVPILVQKPWKKLKNQQVYPLKEIQKEFGIEYFTCSQAYLLALALYEGYKHVNLVGWYNFLPEFPDNEWNNVLWDEIMCQNFWVGFLKGKGIKVTGGNVAKPVTPNNEPIYAYNVSPIHKRKREEIIKKICQK